MSSKIHVIFMFGLSSLFSNKITSTVFIPTRFGFKPLEGEITKASINDVCQYLGYHPDKAYTYFGDLDHPNEIENVVLEVFTSNPIFITTHEPQTTITQSKINSFLKNFDLRREYGDYTGEDILKNGVENRSLDINFLAKVLRIKNPALNGVFTVESIGYHLYINDGYLTDFSPSDGLNIWTKMWMDVNPALTAEYENQAKQYWGDNFKAVIDEVNTQAEAFANTPAGFDNPYIQSHRTEYGLVDFAMLLVCHYGAPIDFERFSILNHGRYKEIIRPDYEGIKCYQVGRFIYSFDLEGDYISRFGA